MASDYDIVKMYKPPTECRDGRCDGWLVEFIYCIVVPVIIVTVLLLLLALIMFCNSKACKCKKYDTISTQNNDIQMENYNSIRRASASLRQMSHNRETPVMGSRASSMTLDRSQRRPHRVRDSCSSAPGTLLRQNHNRQLEHLSRTPPPPYSADHGESFAGHQRRAFPFIVDAPRQPPPPAYSMHSDDGFLGQEFKQSSMDTSMRYDDSPDHNGSGVQPLLFHRSYDG